MGAAPLVLGAVLACLLLAGSLVMTGLFPYGRENAGYSCPDCNVVLITIDTLRADHVSSYGYFQETTPNIDSLAEKGVAFTSAFSQIPHTPPSHWSIFTGLYPYRHGRLMPGDNGTGLDTMQGILGDNGYVTAAFVSSKMLIGFSGEFDYFNGREGGVGLERFITRSAKETTDDVLSWLGAHSGERFFVWIHYFDPHNPYRPESGFDVYDYADEAFYGDSRYDREGLMLEGPIRSDIAKYDGEVRYSDHHVGIVLERLKEAGLEDTTLVVIMSDHGECFGEHDFSGFGYEEEKPCIFHGKTLYDEEVHIPMILMNPGMPLAGTMIDTLVESVDIFPTVLQVLGIRDVPETDGESLVPLIENGERNKDYVMMQTRPDVKGGLFSVGIRTGQWKFVDMAPSPLDIERDMKEQAGMGVETPEEGPDAGQVKKLLFDVRSGENANLILEQAAVAGDLEKRLRNIVSTGTMPGAIAIDEDTEALLRSLGYMS